MKKIGEFITPNGFLMLSTNDWETVHIPGIKLEPGRWEVYIDNDDKARQIILKAKFQEPSPETGEGSSFFQGGKL